MKVILLHGISKTVVAQGFSPAKCEAKASRYCNLRAKMSLIFSFLLFTFSGCGYTSKALLPEGVRSVYVETFSNETMEPRLEIELADEIIERLLFDGNLLVRKPDSADAILTGTLLEYIRQPLRETDNEEIEEYRISIAVRAVFRSRKDKRVFWKSDKLIGDQTYFTRFVPVTAADLITTEEDAKTLALEDLARRVVNGMVEGW